MPYQASIDQQHPGLLLVLLDQSGSMAERYPDASGKTRAAVVSDSIHTLLRDLVRVCGAQEGGGSLLDVSVIGYRTSREGLPEVSSLLSGPWGERPVVAITELARIWRSDPDAAAVNAEWFELDPRGGAPFCAALRYCRPILENWVAQHPESLPPVVLHVAGGEASDGDPLAEAESLTGIATRDGNVLFCNCLISSRTETKVIFPGDDMGLHDEYLRTLTAISSPLPPSLVGKAREEGFEANEHSRGFTLNSPCSQVIAAWFASRMSLHQPYTAPVSKSNPGCLLFLLDQSGAMAEPYGADSTRSRAQVLAETMNRVLKALVLMCVRDGEAQDFFDVGVLGYRGSRGGDLRVGCVFSGSLAGRRLTPLSEVAYNPLRVVEQVQSSPERVADEDAGNVFLPYWIDPVAEGATPMTGALKQARHWLAEWSEIHPKSFPPLVFHLTSGEFTDGDPSEAVQELQSLITQDGQALLFNVHLTSQASPPVLFPDREADLGDDTSRLLFRLASHLPPTLIKAAQRAGLRPGEQARAFACNVDLPEMLPCLEILLPGAGFGPEPEGTGRVL